MDSQNDAGQDQYALDVEVATKLVEQLIGEADITPVDVSNASPHNIEVRMRHWRIWFTDGGRESFASLQVLPDGGFEYFSSWNKIRFGQFVDSHITAGNAREHFIRSYVGEQFREGLELVLPARRPFNELSKPKDAGPRPGLQ